MERGQRNVRRLRRGAALMTEVLAYARVRRAWWIVPIAVILLLLSCLIFIAASVSPLIYTMF